MRLEENEARQIHLGNGLKMGPKFDILKTMKFIINVASPINILQAMRRLGYRFLKKEGQEWSFVMSLERSGYPRFHIYLKPEPNKNLLLFHLHLDQKRPIYKGAAAHSADYQSPLLQKEAARIKAALTKAESIP